MVNACINSLYKEALKNRNIVVMGSDSLHIADVFADRIPDQYIEMGIAESNMVGVAAGFSAAGLIPFVYAVSPFLVYRANEFIRDDVSLQKRNVKIIGYSAGMDYCTSGPTHHTTEDIAMLRVLPNLTILSPASVKEVEEMIMEAVKIDGPVYIRLGRERDREIHGENYIFHYGMPQIEKDGNDVVIISTGTITYDSIRAAEIAEDNGISVKVISIPTLKTIDEATLLEEIACFHKVITVEEHSIIGGLGGMISEIIADHGLPVKVQRMGLNDRYAKGYGNHDEIKKMNGLSVDDIVECLMEK